MPTVRLRIEPSVQQAAVILARVDRALTALGAQTEPDLRHEKIRFRIPPPWQRRRLGPLVLATGGIVQVSAGWGEPRRLRYELRFVPLYAAGLLLTAALVVYGWGWSRMVLLGALLWLWVAVYLLLLLATRRLRRVLAASAREILERRSEPRPEPPAAASAEPPQPTPERDGGGAAGR